MKVYEWIRPEKANPRSYKFICSKCNKEVYARPMIRLNNEPSCDYKYCPYCRANMRVEE